MRAVLSKIGHSGLRQIKQRDDNHKKTDKGGATVIIDRKDYFNEAMRQLTKRENCTEEDMVTQVKMK